MNGKELYEKYKGRRAAFEDLTDGLHTGVVVGYSTTKSWMIMAVTKGKGWGRFVCSTDDSIIIMDKKNNRKGFLYVDERDIIND